MILTLQNGLLSTRYVEETTEKKQFTQYIELVYPMSKHDRGLDHHICFPNTKLVFLTFNHHKE